MNIIFRDLVNYSRESVGLILEPAWKLLNINLKVYTEVGAYGHTLKFEDTDTISEQDKEKAIADCKSRENNCGVIGMTMKLLELLTTLGNKGSVRMSLK